MTRTLLTLLLTLLPLSAVHADDPPAPRPVRAQDSAQLKIYPIKHRDARALVDLVNRFIGRGNVAYDARTNALVVQASTADLARVDALLLKLDVKETARTGIRTLTQLDGPLVREMKLFRIRHAEPHSVMRMAKSVLDANDTLSIDEASRTLVVRAGATTLVRVAKLVEQLDQPRPSVELTFHLLLLSAEPGNVPVRALPEALTSLAGQFRKVFAYQQVQRLDTLLVRGQAGASFGGSSSAGGLQVKGLLHHDAESKELVLERFDARRIVSQTSSYRLESTIKVGDGKTVAIGMAVGDNAKSAMVLVVHARTVE